MTPFGAPTSIQVPLAVLAGPKAASTFRRGDELMASRASLPDTSKAPVTGASVVVFNPRNSSPGCSAFPFSRKP